jgi:hypothetical protein
MKRVVLGSVPGLALISALLSTSFVVITSQAAGSADLFQGRNGTPASPVSPVEFIKGNAGPANSHYIEGYSIPYEVVITGASSGPHTLVLEWDTTQQGKHAMDYITHFDRLLPHNQFGSHTQPETINPLVGIPGPFNAPETYPIPAPTDTNSPVAGQPTASFNSLAAAERVMTIWNGSITRLVYLHEDSPSQDSGTTRMSVEFEARTPTVVIAWGGHIASQVDWGTGNSATEIDGSPYHMRMISFDGGGGNQDRSLQAYLVTPAPSCLLSGPPMVCAATTNTYDVTTDSTLKLTYEWAVLNNTAGASFIGSTRGSSVQVQSGNPGSYSVQVTLSVNGISSTCTFDTVVNALTAATALADKTVCQGTSVIFSTTPSGTGPFTFVWRKGNIILPEANSTLTIAAASPEDAGQYCVEVTGVCGTVGRCATLTVQALPRIVCPADLAFQCLNDVPPPDIRTVSVSGGAGVVTVTHTGDTLATNGCELVINRNYRATDACGFQDNCAQTIRVRDTIAPVITCPPNRTIECGMEWGFGTPTALDNCDGTNAVISVMSTVTNSQCGKTFVASRTWQAMDHCGNTSLCSQTVTVVDTIPPVVTCAGDRIVECSAAWAFDEPTATDVCNDGPVHIVAANTMTNQLIGALFRAQRTWIATDDCGNTATCSQTVTLVDTIPPTLTCPANITVLCSGSTGAAVSFAPAASDACDSNPRVTCNPPSGSIFALGITLVTCAATDQSSNRTECQFTITVQDTEPPRITCPSDLTLLENQGAANDVSVSYDAPSASDNCDNAPSIVCVPATGSAFPLGDTIVTCTATDASGNHASCSFVVRVQSPPIILVQPADVLVPLGGFAQLCVVVSGSEPLSFQWRRNGANIPGATNQCFTVPSVELSDGGTYTVVVANQFGTATSDPALLRLDVPKLTVGDNFVDRILLVRTDGIARGTNRFATKEPGEPNHAGKPGGSSVWYTWTAPDDGIATFRTIGSTFDTLLAVYTGPDVGSLTSVIFDEDGGGFYTSGTRFNAVAGESYQVAIDGYGGASGEFVLNWSLEVTLDVLPVITNQPMSQTVAPGATATFFVGAYAICRDSDHDCRDRDRDGHPDHPSPHLLNLSYQWFFNGSPIPGATANTLTIANVQDSNVGTYIVQISNGGRVIFSEAAILQINQTEGTVQSVQARDKFLDSFTTTPLRLGNGGAHNAGGNASFQAASTVVRGYTGTQVFNTSGSATETGEDPICGVVGGSSEWVSFVAEETGSVFLNTDGSSYDTVMAVFTRMTNAPTLQLLGCDNNGGLDGHDSSVVVPVQAGKTNFIVVDGVNGATGVLHLNYNLVTTAVLEPLGTATDGASRVRLNVRPGAKFTIQRSTNLLNWSSLITTNTVTGVFDYTDAGSVNLPSRFYRALLLP